MEKQNNPALRLKKRTVTELNDSELLGIISGTIVRPFTKDTSSLICETFETSTKICTQS